MDSSGRPKSIYFIRYNLYFMCSRILRVSVYLYVGILFKSLLTLKNFLNASPIVYQFPLTDGESDFTNFTYGAS